MKERVACRAAWRLTAFGKPHVNKEHHMLLQHMMLFIMEDWAIKLKET